MNTEVLHILHSIAAILNDQANLMNQLRTECDKLYSNLTWRSTMPFLNRIHNAVNSFVEKHIVSIDAEKKEKAKEELTSLVTSLVREAAKGLAEGAAESIKSAIEKKVS